MEAYLDIIKQLILGYKFKFKTYVAYTYKTDCIGDVVYDITYNRFVVKENGSVHHITFDDRMIFFIDLEEMKKCKEWENYNLDYYFDGKENYNVREIITYLRSKDYLKLIQTEN